MKKAKYGNTSRVLAFVLSIAMILSMHGVQILAEDSTAAGNSTEAVQTAQETFTAAETAVTESKETSAAAETAATGSKETSAAAETAATESKETSVTESVTAESTETSAAETSEAPVEETAKPQEPDAEVPETKETPQTETTAETDALQKSETDETQPEETEAEAAEEEAVLAPVADDGKTLDIFGAMITSAVLRVKLKGSNEWQTVSADTAINVKNVAVIRVDYEYDTSRAAQDFTTQDTLTYTFPSDFKVTQGQGGTIKDPSTNKEIGSYSIETGNLIKVKFDKTKNHLLRQITGSGFFEGSLGSSVTGSNQETYTIIIGSCPVTIRLKDPKPDPKALEISKKAEKIDNDPTHLKYTITVTNNGTVDLTDVAVKDTFTSNGNCAAYEELPKVTEPEKAAKNATGTGFVISNVTLASGKSKTFTYKVKITDGKGKTPWEFENPNKGYHTKITVANKAEAESKEYGLKAAATAKTVFEKIWIWKSGEMRNVGSETKPTTVHYTVHANETGSGAQLIDVTGWTITDTWSEQQQIQFPLTLRSYASLEAYNKDRDHPIETHTITKDDPNFKLDEKKRTWIYTIPAEFGKAFLDIQYDMTLTADKDPTMQPIGNTAAIGNGSGKVWSHSWGTLVNGNLQNVGVKKVVDETKGTNGADGRTVHWKSTITTKIPAPGNGKKFEYQDAVDTNQMKFPTQALNLHVYSAQDSELTETEDYRISVLKEGEFKLEFLKEHAAGVYLTYDTVINTQIAQQGREYKNTAKVWYAGLSATATAAYKYAHALIKKAEYLGGASIEYTVTVNPGAKRLNEGNPLALMDLPGGSSAKVDQGTIKIRPQSVADQVRVDAYGEDFRGFNIQNIPDETEVTISYDVVFSAQVDEQVDLSNTATLMGSGKNLDHIDTERSFEVKLSGMSGTAKSGTYYVRKYSDDGKMLNGAEFELYRIDQAAYDAKKETIVGKESLIGTYTSQKEEAEGGKDGLVTFCDLVFNTVYYYVETKAPEGYAPEAARHYFMIANPKNLPSEVPQGVELVNSGYLENIKNYRLGRIEIAKQVWINGAATDGSKMDGTYYFALYNDRQEMVGTPKSVTVTNGVQSGKAAVFEKLAAGTYTVREVIAAGDGWQPYEAENVAVVVKEAGAETEDGAVTVKLAETTQVTVENRLTRKMNFKKTDLAGEELIGAALSITDEQGKAVTDMYGKVIESWVSNGTPHPVEGMKNGTYLLTETSAPAGYAVADSLRFTIKDGVIAGTQEDTVTIQDDALKLSVTKVDIANDKKLAGAALVVKDETGKVIDEWVSAKTTHEIGEKLIGGMTYTLSETAAPNGYDTITTDIRFRMEKDGKVTLLSSTEGEAQLTDGVLLVKDTFRKEQPLGSITVTKSVTLTVDGGVKKIALDADFYVGLFADEAGTMLVERYDAAGKLVEGGVKTLALKGDSKDGMASVTFDNLALGTYYVYETTADGARMTNDSLLEIQYSASLTALTLEHSHTAAAITNHYLTPPGGYTFVEEPKGDESEKSETETEETETKTQNETEKTVTKTSDAAKTGDTANAWIYLMLLLVAVLSCGGTVIYRGKKNLKNK